MSYLQIFSKSSLVKLLPSIDVRHKYQFLNYQLLWKEDVLSELETTTLMVIHFTTLIKFGVI